MKQLDLYNNEDIDDRGAAVLLECLSNMERLRLMDCNISFEMQTALYERGREEGCEVNCGFDLTK